MDKDIKLYLADIAEQHIDATTGEVNLTTMAEAAAQEFQYYGPPPTFPIPDEMFDWAFEVADRLGLID